MIFLMCFGKEVATSLSMVNKINRRLRTHQRPYQVSLLLRKTVIISDLSDNYTSSSCKSPIYTCSSLGKDVGITE